MTTCRLEDNKAFVLRFFFALNAGDVQRIVAAYSPDGCVQTLGNTLISGTFSLEQIAVSASAIFDVFPKGLQFTVTGMVAEGDKVAVEARSQGEHVSGKTYSNHYHFLFELAGGKLRCLKEYMDTERVTDVLCGGVRPPLVGN